MRASDFSVASTCRARSAARASRVSARRRWVCAKAPAIGVRSSWALFAVKLRSASSVRRRRSIRWLTAAAIGTISLGIGPGASGERSPPPRASMSAQSCRIGRIPRRTTRKTPPKDRGPAGRAVVPGLRPSPPPRRAERTRVPRAGSRANLGAPVRHRSGGSPSRRSPATPWREDAGIGIVRGEDHGARLVAHDVGQEFAVGPHGGDALEIARIAVDDLHHRERQDPLGGFLDGAVEHLVHLVAQDHVGRARRHRPDHGEPGRERDRQPRLQAARRPHGLPSR